jgi:tRNA nucleotidyltransferase (CCA-adding enzyme)
MQLPQPVQAVLTRLELAGHGAWLVGGCVRDGLLGRPIHDWDITTAALPEETMALFPKTVPTGIRHGTVTVLEGGLSLEVTTYRADGDYGDGRHPNQVAFVRRVEDDLARRDFTINAMAMDRHGKLLDLFGGREDLARQRLRCVGDPDTRFGEDALRMLRALRFSAQLGFAVEPETLAAIGRCAALTEKLSAERVRDEVEKTLCSPRPAVVSQMASLGLLPGFGLTGRGDLTALQTLPDAPAARWAGLLRAEPAAELERFKLTKVVLKTARQAVTHCQPQFDDEALRRLAAAVGPDTARVTAALCGVSAALEAQLASGCCLSLRQLAVTGREFPQIQGPALGQLLARLLDHVLACPQDNQRDRLLELAAQWS